MRGHESNWRRGLAMTRVALVGGVGVGGAGAGAKSHQAETKISPYIQIEQILKPSAIKFGGQILTIYRKNYRQDGVSIKEDNDGTPGATILIDSKSPTLDFSIAVHMSRDGVHGKLEPSTTDYLDVTEGNLTRPLKGKKIQNETEISSSEGYIYHGNHWWAQNTTTFRSPDIKPYGEVTHGNDTHLDNPSNPKEVKLRIGIARDAVFNAGQMLNRGLYQYTHKEK